MADVSLTRYVDNQRTQVRWLLSSMQNHPELSNIEYSCYFSAAARAIHLTLTGYFAELTQPRFQAAIWPSLFACGGSFDAMQKVALCEDYLIRVWLELEWDAQTFLPSLLATLNIQINPQQSPYKSALLSDTSLTETSSVAVIASSTGALPMTLLQLADAWSEIDALINRERAQALEC